MKVFRKPIIRTNGSQDTKLYVKLYAGYKIISKTNFISFAEFSKTNRMKDKEGGGRNS